MAQIPMALYFGKIPRYLLAQDVMSVPTNAYCNEQKSIQKCTPARCKIHAGQNNDNMKLAHITELLYTAIHQLPRPSLLLSRIQFIHGVVG